MGGTYLCLLILMDEASGLPVTFWEITPPARIRRIYKLHSCIAEPERVEDSWLDSIQNVPSALYCMPNHEPFNRRVWSQQVELEG
ncbi:hypothetical protein MJO29_001158 [Puccinia striiformis f. sp. tritici]|nr:hypothetical protein MJO29_001158 [Puccinia striiformis f. sp. tritici]